MKKYTFIATTDLGDGQTYVDVNLTDEEAALLEKYGKISSVYYEGFSSCRELDAIYSKVYNEAVDVLTDELLEYEEDADEDWRADDTYSVQVHFPEEFEEELSAE